MELASMLSGERFSDRPASACPIIGAILRAHNDTIDDTRRGDLYRYAAEVVGTRGEFALQLRRAQAALAWARSRYLERRRSIRGRIRPLPAEPAPDWGPDQIARYVIRSLGSDGHDAVLQLLDRLIEMAPPAPAPTAPAPALTTAGSGVPELVEQPGYAIEHGRRGAQLVVGEFR
jgi:hypothetical protein